MIKTMEATYHFSVYRFDKPMIHYSVPCEVVSETKTRLKIKLLETNVNGHDYGDEIWVRKDKVTYPKAHVDTTSAWWHN